MLELDFKVQEGIFWVRMGWEDIPGKGNGMYKCRYICATACGLVILNYYSINCGWVGKEVG